MKHEYNQLSRCLYLLYEFKYWIIADFKFMKRERHTHYTSDDIKIWVKWSSFLRGVLCHDKGTTLVFKNGENIKKIVLHDNEVLNYHSTATVWLL